MDKYVVKYKLTNGKSMDQSDLKYIMLGLGLKYFIPILFQGHRFLYRPRGYFFLLSFYRFITSTEINFLYLNSSISKLNSILKIKFLKSK